MGSLSSLITIPKHSYILGLWGADKYVRTSSLGLSNTDIRLITIFKDFLLDEFPLERIRLRIYGEVIPTTFSDFKVSFCKPSKNVKQAYHIYVNSRPLVREFYKALNDRHMLRNGCIDRYFAGRFDGDGSLSKGNKYCRIAYSNLNDLDEDKKLLNGIKTSTYRYKQAGTYCLYFSEKTLKVFLDKIRPYVLTNKLNNPVSTEA